MILFRDRSGVSISAVLAGILLGACAPAASAPGTTSLVPSPDPRIGLAPGIGNDAGQAAWNLDLVAHVPRPPAFTNPNDPFDFDFGNTDMAFQGDVLFVGSYHGVQIYDISDPTRPRLRTAIVCPGGQGDLSVYRNLLFMSVEEPRGRVDCGTQGAPGAVNPERVLGIRIFDISDLDTPRQVASVQTCRGSHTHTLVTDPNDAQNVYIYVSGTGPSRSEQELPGCRGVHWRQDPGTAF
ncbi:MAG TPA: hypothetical protein VMN39_06105, partial [Longimicrobiaceae bacterium]|nr:hypothetical protein [Longimicrobiaceae bacterium]